MCGYRLASRIWTFIAVDGAYSESTALELQIIVTGMHLSPEYGLTLRDIETDGFTIDRKVDILLSSSTVVGVSKSMGLGVIGFADALAELQPDLCYFLETATGFLPLPLRP